MNVQNLELIPTVQLWKMADADPSNEMLQREVAARKRFKQWLFDQNGKDSRERNYNNGPTLFPPLVIP